MQPGKTVTSGYTLLIADGPRELVVRLIRLCGVDLVVLVGEPSISGLNDLQRIHELLKMGV